MGHICQNIRLLRPVPVLHAWSFDMYLSVISWNVLSSVDIHVTAQCSKVLTLSFLISCCYISVSSFICSNIYAWIPAFISFFGCYSGNLVFHLISLVIYMYSWSLNNAGVRGTKLLTSRKPTCSFWFPRNWSTSTHCWPEALLLISTADWHILCLLYTIFL